MTRNTLGPIVLRRRNERGLTQRDLAAMLGVKASHIAYIENGHRKPSIALINRMARVLKLDARRLLEAAHPEARLILAGASNNGAARGDAFREFAAQKPLLRKHHVTPEELTTLRKVHDAGHVPHPDRFLFLLMAIRSVRS